MLEPMADAPIRPAVTHAAGLRDYDFVGFVPFDDLPRFEDPVPRTEGVYAVVRPGEPVFLEQSPAGHFKGNDPTVTVDALAAKWVPDVEVVYVGKATARTAGRGLRKRLDEYRRYGAGMPVAHQGGRYVWQLAGHEQLSVAWLETPNVDAGVVEAQLIADFEATTGRIPFANLNHGRATLEVTTDVKPHSVDVKVSGSLVSRANYTFEADVPRIELGQVDTHLKVFRRRGHAMTALRRLVEAHPGVPVVDSPLAMNSDDGNALVARARSEGLPIHANACFAGGRGCRCPLAGA